MRAPKSVLVGATSFLVAFGASAVQFAGGAPNFVVQAGMYFFYAALCLAVAAFLFFNIRLLFGSYRSLSPKPWREQLW